ncbi:hypothetical protein Taro_035344 [Colocasia esculenta]|uniref:DUF4219 domain-containing protein n=1 Tax=Colocasia esculenta TaxID=4460 RepID=A0A843WCY2_COLES|nr:hypothetical protein [Colocasia esculenta]
MAAQGHFERQSVNRPPLFDGEDYTYWKTRMKFFLQGLDYQIWSIIEEGDLLVTNEKDKWTEDDKKKISLNYKAKSILCCSLSKKEFNRISACKSTMEMWEKLRITYEGTDKVKETRIDILVTQYERFQMQSGETITQMHSRFTDITNGLAVLGKTYEMGDMVRKNLRSLPASWTPKVMAIEEANDLKRMSLEKLIGSLMAHEINMERLGESSSRKKHSNALKTSVAEGEAIIGKAQEVLEEVAEAAVAADVPVEQEDQHPAVAPIVQEQQQEVVSSEIVMDQAAAAAEVRAEESVVTGSQIENIHQDNIELVMRVSEAIIPTTVVASVLRNVLESIPSTQGEPEMSSELVADVVASGHTDDVVMEDAPIEG